MIGSFITTMHLLMHHVSCRVFWWNIKSPGDSAPLQPRFGALWLLAFPKTKIAFVREEIPDCLWDSGKCDGAADGDWENCVRSQEAYFKGIEVSLSYVQCFLYLVPSSINVSIIVHGSILSGQTLHILLALAQNRSLTSMWNAKL